MKKAAFLFFFLAAALALSGCTQPAANGGTGTNVKRVAAGDKIAVEYRGTLADGTEFDSSQGRTPLEFTAGRGQMIDGFDSAVIGMVLNEEKTVTLQPSQAYGELDPSKIVEIPKSQIADADSLQVGMSVTSSQGINGIVEETKPDSVVINFNQSLAGKALTFWIKVVKIEKA